MEIIIIIAKNAMINANIVTARLNMIVLNYKLI